MGGTRARVPRSGSGIAMALASSSGRYQVGKLGKQESPMSALFDVPFPKESLRVHKFPRIVCACMSRAPALLMYILGTWTFCSSPIALHCSLALLLGKQFSE